MDNSNVVVIAILFVSVAVDAEKKKEEERRQKSGAFVVIPGDSPPVFGWLCHCICKASLVLVCNAEYVNVLRSFIHRPSREYLSV